MKEDTKGIIEKMKYDGINKIEITKAKWFFTIKMGKLLGVYIDCYISPKCTTKYKKTDKYILALLRYKKIKINFTKILSYDRMTINEI